MEVQSQFIEMFGKGNWEQKCLGEIGTFKRGGGFQKSDYVEHGIPCIHYGQIHTKFGPFIYSHITEISTDLEPKTKFASKGDLIIAITSEDTEGSCKSTAWLGDYPVAVGGHAAIFHHCMNPLYMSFFFKSTLFNYAKMEYIHGTKVFEVKPDNIAKILVPCPPMSLQKQFSVIARQADKSKFVGFKSQFIEMFKNLPVNGVIKDLTVGNIASVKKSYSKEDIINYIDISSIDNTTKTIVETSEHLVTKAPSRAQQCVQKGDILVSTVRPINRNIAVIEKDTSHLVASTGFCILRPQEGYKEYLLSIVLSDTYTEKMYDKANGGLYPAVNNSDVLNYGIHIPDEDTAKKVSALYQQSDKSKLLHRTSIKYSKYSL